MILVEGLTLGLAETVPTAITGGGALVVAATALLIVAYGVN